MKSENKIRLLEDSIDTLDDLFYVFDKKGNFLDWNKTVEKVTGYTEKEIKSMSPPDFFEGKDKEKIQNGVKKAIETGESRVEAQLVTKNGEKIPYEFKTSKLKKRNIEGICGIGRNITERKKRKKELEEKSEKYSTLVEQSHDAIIVVQDRKLVFVNPKMEEITGYSKEELLGMEYSELLHPDYINKVEKYYKQRIKGGSPPKRYQLKMIDKTGDEHILEISVSRIEYNQDPATMANLRDITEQKKYEHNLKEKSDQLDILNRIIRHDIRNDINVIDLYLENILDNEYLQQEIKDDLEKIKDRSRHVTELTKVSRDIAETVAKNKQKAIAVDLKEPLKEQIEDIKASYPDTKIELKNEIPEIDVQADEMLSSVFRNILHNSVQHNDKESPKVEISSEEKDSTVIISITDNGPGIPDDLKEIVFGKGEKSMDSTGTGIGLYLVEELIDSYNGDIWIEDNKPEGSIFKIKLQKITK